MSIAVAALLVVNLALGAVLLLRLRALRARVAAFETHRPAPESGTSAAGVLTPLITVQILNAQELAARESWAARRFGALIPRRVAREVAARAAEQMAEQLAAQGVQAQVRVHALGTTVPAVGVDSREDTLEDTVATGTAGVREVHGAIAAIPFDLLDAIPPARAVRVVHDRTADGVYDTVAAVNRLAGRLLRGGARRPPAAP